MSKIYKKIEPLYVKITKKLPMLYTMVVIVTFLFDLKKNGSLTFEKNAAISKD